MSWLCRLGFHSWSYVHCESGLRYDVCRRCGVWLNWDGHAYTKKVWPPTFPGYFAFYNDWLSRNIENRVKR